MKKEKLKIIIAYVLVFLWMIVIFLFSSASGDNSGSSSKGIITGIITIGDNLVVKIGIKDELYTPEEKDEITENLNYPLRKVAHFSEYFILALLWLNALSLSKIKHKYLYTILICIMYALTDEYHQTFIMGRSGNLRDTFIDSSGSLASELIWYLQTRFRKK